MAGKENWASLQSSDRFAAIPTVSDRIAQMVVKSRLEPVVDPLFYPDSFGYRPGKPALDAVGQTRQRCWRYDWILDLDQQWRSFHHLAAHGAQTFGGQTSEVKQTLRERMHEKVPRVGKWLGRVLEGYYQYHAVPGNLKGLSYFRERVSRYWWASARKAQLTEAASTIWFRC